MHKEITSHKPMSSGFVPELLPQKMQGVSSRTDFSELMWLKQSNKQFPAYKPTTGDVWDFRWYPDLAKNSLFNFFFNLSK